VSGPFFLPGPADDPTGEPDRIDGMPHPRETLALAGHAEAERSMLDAWSGGRLHHAWLIAGPSGIGKATLAYRFARFLLANGDAPDNAMFPPADLALAADHALTTRVARLSHPDLTVIRRSATKDGKSIRAEITVEDVRDGLGVLGMTAGGGGYRIVIVDAADDMNRNAANALLKQLEEPPPRTVFLLVTHQPATLLPTIRSRCRFLRLKPLGADDVAGVLAAIRATGVEVAAPDPAMLADGSAGAILRRAGAAENTIRAEAKALFRALPALDPVRLQAVLPSLVGRDGEATLSALLDQIGREMAGDLRRLSHRPALLAARAEVWDKLSRTARETET
jgi:DNA polymerase III subunit delta'